jgi:hypothetical protein
MPEHHQHDLESYLGRLRAARNEAAFLGIDGGVEGVQRLADLQGAIAAVEAVIAEGGREPDRPGDHDLMARSDRPSGHMGFG